MLPNISAENFLNKLEPILIKCGNLPHWFQENKLIYDTLRIGDSIPFDILQDYLKKKDEFTKLHQKPWSPETKTIFEIQIKRVIEKYLDSGYGACYFKDPMVREIIEEEFEKFNGIRYQLFDYVIMPNHMHFLILPSPEIDYDKLIGNIKRKTAIKINSYLKRNGQVWQREGFDRIVRDYKNLVEIIQYIHDNPIGLNPCTYTLRSSINKP